jgi:hypothetical protein
MLERRAVQPGEGQHIAEGAVGVRVDVDVRPGRFVRRSRLRRPRIQFENAVVRHPSQRGRVVDDRVDLRLAFVGLVVTPGAHVVGRVVWPGLVPEPWPVRTARIAESVHRTPLQVREHEGGDARVVSDEVSFGRRGARGAGGEEHLVEVRDPEPLIEVPDAFVREGVQRRQLVRGRRRPLVRRDGLRSHRHAVVRAFRLRLRGGLVFDSPSSEPDATAASVRSITESSSPNPLGT